jgi:hypothetical protein
MCISICIYVCVYLFWAIFVHYPKADGVEFWRPPPYSLSARAQCGTGHGNAIRRSNKKMWGWFGWGQKPTSYGNYSTWQCQSGQDRTCFPLISFPLNATLRWLSILVLTPDFDQKSRPGAEGQDRHCLELSSQWLDSNFRRFQAAKFFKFRSRKTRKARKTEIRIKPCLYRVVKAHGSSARLFPNHEETPKQNSFQIFSNQNNLHQKATSSKVTSVTSRLPIHMPGLGSPFGLNFHVSSQVKLQRLTWRVSNNWGQLTVWEGFEH